MYSFWNGTRSESPHGSSFSIYVRGREWLASTRMSSNSLSTTPLTGVHHVRRTIVVPLPVLTGT